MQTDSWKPSRATETGPWTRIVIPAHGARATIGPCVQAVCGAGLRGRREVVVVDDGENGDLAASLAAYPVEVRVNQQPGSAGRARNCGARGFRGDVLLFVDADVTVEPGAPQRLIDATAGGDAEAAVGNYSGEVSGMPFAQQYKSLYLHRVYSRTAGCLRNEFWTALGAVRASTFRSLGGFAPRFDGCLGEDTEFGQRLTAAGCRIVAVPGACGRHLHRMSWPDLFANDFRKGGKTLQLFLKRGSSLSSFRHCRPRDMLSVALACAVPASLGAAILGLLPLAVGLVVTALIAVVYGWTRSDLLSSFAAQGGWFLVRAAVTMHLLDLTRAVCVARSLTRAVVLKGLQVLDPVLPWPARWTRVHAAAGRPPP